MSRFMHRNKGPQQTSNMPQPQARPHLPYCQKRTLKGLYVPLATRLVKHSFVQVLAGAIVGTQTPCQAPSAHNLHHQKRRW